jgi:hypothetical protein
MAIDFQTDPEPGVAALAGGIINDAQTLLKQELALAKREVLDELHKSKEAAIFLGSGVAIAAQAGLLLAFMLVHLLHSLYGEYLPLWGCYGIVSACLGLIGLGLLLAGKHRASTVHLMPQQTIASMKDNVAWIRNQA